MTKKESLLKAYQKEIKRLKQFERRANKRGYVFDNLIPDKPKRITEASIRRLEKITAQSAYKKASYIAGVDIETGEPILISGTKARKQERQQAYEKGRTKRAVTMAIKKDRAEREKRFKQKNEAVQKSLESLGVNVKESSNFTNIVIADYMERFAEKGKVGQYILDQIKKLIHKYGAEEVAHKLEDAANKGLVAEVTEAPSDEMKIAMKFIAAMIDFLEEGQEEKDEIKKHATELAEQDAGFQEFD